MEEQDKIVIVDREDIKITYDRYFTYIDTVYMRKVDRIISMLLTKNYIHSTKPILIRVFNTKEGMKGKSLDSVMIGGIAYSIPDAKWYEFEQKVIPTINEIKIDLNLN